MRRMSAHFRTGLDAMIREAEMQELETKWAAQNAKIMREHPADAPPEAEPTGAYPARPLPAEPPRRPPRPRPRWSLRQSRRAPRHAGLGDKPEA
jgi:sec-independent protein translocase protein TatB